MEDRKRVKLHSVSVSADGGRAVAEVELRFGSRRFLGRSEASDDRSDEQWLVASATFEAVQKLVGPKVHFALDRVHTQNLKSGRAVLLSATVEVVGEEGDLRIGSCLVAGDDIAGATAKAALDSANRAMSLHLPFVAA